MMMITINIIIAFSGSQSRRQSVYPASKRIWITSVSVKW